MNKQIYIIKTTVGKNSSFSSGNFSDSFLTS